MDHEMLFQVYLRPWALGLEIPIVSIDYSLAPEYPFPRAIEECFYAYAWILKNASKLGWTGKTILLAGDSAGGNLVTIVTMKAIEMGLRKPNAIICFYTPLMLGYRSVLIWKEKRCQLVLARVRDGQSNPISEKRMYW